MNSTENNTIIYTEQALNSIGKKFLTHIKREDVFTNILRRKNYQHYRYVYCKRNRIKQ